MPSTKSRIHLTIPKTMNRVLTRLAARDQMSLATKTLDLVRQAIDIDEDAALLSVAEKRERKPAKAVSHADAWV